MILSRAFFSWNTYLTDWLISRVTRLPSLLTMTLHNWIVDWKVAATILLQLSWPVLSTLALRTTWSIKSIRHGLLHEHWQRAESFILSHINTQVTSICRSASIKQFAHPHFGILLWKITKSISHMYLCLSNMHFTIWLYSYKRRTLLDYSMHIKIKYPLSRTM